MDNCLLKVKFCFGVFLLSGEAETGSHCVAPSCPGTHCIERPGCPGTQTCLPLPQGIPYDLLRCFCLTLGATIQFITLKDGRGGIVYKLLKARDTLCPDIFSLICIQFSVCMYACILEEGSRVHKWL